MLKLAVGSTKKYCGKTKKVNRCENNFHVICKIFCIEDVGLGVREKRVKKNMTINQTCFL